jgi:hypothetical protein
MSWKLKGNPKTEQITKALAEKFVNMEAAQQDRPLSETRLRVYEKIAREGGFRPVSWAAAYCKATGGTYRVNGKHTSTLFAKMLDELPTLYAVVEYYECDELEDTADINRSFAACVPDLAGVDQRTINLCASALAYAKLGDSVHRSTTPAERAEGLLEHHDFVTWCHDLCGSGSGTTKSSHLKRMPVIAAMYATWDRAPLVSKKFWEEVRDETGGTPSDPTRKLARFLILTSSANNRNDVRQRHRVKDKEFFVKSLHAWNAFRKKESTDLKYYANAAMPTVA